MSAFEVVVAVVVLAAIGLVGYGEISRADRGAAYAITTGTRMRWATWLLAAAALVCIGVRVVVLST